MSLGESLVDGVSDNLRTLLLVVGGYVLLVEGGVAGFGYPSVSLLPDWWPLIAVLVGAVVLVGYMVGGMLGDLLEDDDEDETWDVIVREVQSDRTDCAEYGFTEEGFSNTVILGKLRLLEDAPGEARRYDAYSVTMDPPWTDNPGYPEDEDPCAVMRGCYLGQRPDANLVGHYDGEDARREIGEIKDEYEDLAASGTALIEHYPAMIRRVDREHAVRWADRLGMDVAGDVGETSDTEAMIREVLPEDLIPATMFTGDELAEVDADAAADEVADDLEHAETTDGPTAGEIVGALVDAEPSELGGSVDVATDGGEPDA